MLSNPGQHRRALERVAFHGWEIAMAMTKCHECTKDISTTAAACPHCGAKPKPKTSGCAWIAAVVIGVPMFLAIFGTANRPPATVSPAASPARSKPATPSAPPEAPKAVLRLVSFNCTQDSIGNAIVEGSVKNISDRPIEQAVKVHASFYDKADNKLGSDSGYLDFKPLLVNQDAPFKIYGVRNPAYSKCSVDAMSVGFGTQLRWESSKAGK